MDANRARGLRTTAAAANSPYWEMHNPSATLGPVFWVKHVSAILNTAVQTELLLIRPATSGTAQNPVNSVHLNTWALPTIGAGVSLAKFATAWTVLPTIGAGGNVIARSTLPGTVGASVSWDFEGNSLALKAGEKIVLWNGGAGAGAILDVNVQYFGS